MMTLTLIRHAKTETLSSTGTDFDRMLTEKGIAQANLLGHYVQHHHLQLGKMLCSSSVRTQQTKSIICQHLAEKCCVNYLPELYLADSDSISKLLGEQDENNITIIGHNEGISDLAIHFSEETTYLRTAEMICLTFPFDDWKLAIAGTASITLRYRPEVFLPKMAVVLE